MGFFSLKKKSNTPATSPGVAPPTASPQRTPRAVASPRLPSTPTFAAEPPRPTIQLHVALHPSPSDELFWIEVDPEDEVEAIRRAICGRIGDVALGLFKVAIPSHAFEQASEYGRRYKDAVDLIGHFPSYALDDSQQIRHSLGPAGWQTQLPDRLRIKDWFPSPPSSSDTISIIARPAPHPSSSVYPLTLFAHFASPTEGHAVGTASPSLGSSRTARRLPTPVDVLPSHTVAELKCALLRADNRAVDKLDKVVLWRVEMSEEEMVVIEQRGGLKAGQMPWPYPPTAQVPTAISNDHLPISHYFPNYHSNTSLVSLSVWIHPSATHALSRISPAEALEAPPFRYPMTFPLPEIRRASTSQSLPTDSPPLDLEVTVHAETLPSRVAGRSRRARPSTAPDALSTPAFGSPLRSLRARSPLARPPVHDSRMKGLGIAGSELPAISVGMQEQRVDQLTEGMTRLDLKVDMGQTAAAITLTPPEADTKIIWQPAVGTLRRSETQSRGIRSLANNKSLRAYEIC